VTKELGIQGRQPAEPERHGISHHGPSQATRTSPSRQEALPTTTGLGAADTLSGRVEARSKGGRRVQAAVLLHKPWSGWELWDFTLQRIAEQVSATPIFLGLPYPEHALDPLVGRTRLTASWACSYRTRSRSPKSSRWISACAGIIRASKFYGRPDLQPGIRRPACDRPAGRVE